MLATRHVLIGLPAYNEEIALPRLLARVESLRKSSPEPITVVLYNDGSTDATLATARAWQERVRLVILDGIVNKGLGAGLCALVDYAVANALCLMSLLVAAADRRDARLYRGGRRRGDRLAL